MSTDGGQSRAERLTLAVSEPGWEAERRVFLYFVYVVNIKSGALLQRQKAEVTSGSARKEKLFKRCDIFN